MRRVLAELVVASDLEALALEQATAAGDRILAEAEERAAEILSRALVAIGGSRNPVDVLVPPPGAIGYELVRDESGKPLRLVWWGVVNAE